MGQTPLVLPPRRPGDEERFDRFIRGLVLNPPRRSFWANWRTRHLRKDLLR